MKKIPLNTIVKCRWCGCDIIYRGFWIHGDGESQCLPREAAPEIGWEPPVDTAEEMESQLERLCAALDDDYRKRKEVKGE